MKVRNARSWSPHGSRRFVIALVAVAAAMAARYLLHPLLGTRLPFVSFTIAALVVEFTVGLAPALLVIALGLVVGDFFFLPPYFTFGPLKESDVYSFAGFVGVAVLGVALIEALQRSKYEAKLMKEVAQSRYEMLLQSYSERDLAQANARTTEQRFRAFTQAVPEIWYMRRIAGGFEYVSEEFYRVTGVTPGTLEGRGWLATLHPDDIDQVKAQWDRVVDTGEPEVLSVRLRAHDGSYLPYRGILACIEDNQGKVIKWVGAPAGPLGTAKPEPDASHRAGD